MDWKLGRLSLLAVLMAPASVLACDWVVAKRVDPMTDKQVCIVTSEAAKIGLSIDQDRVSFLTGSAYRSGRDSLQVRVDDNPAILIGERGRSTSNFEDAARVALRQILSGSRLRTSYRDYPASQEGDAEICTLPEIMRDCGAPIERIMDTRSQSEIIHEMMKR